ncbi:zinc-dependent alcohol dehydrogenase [Salinisphaera orenii]|nr:alcohol dehydrogenase catalytic domain-containing protein [Salinisphaera orenii]
MLALRKTSTAFGLDVVEVDEPGPPAAHEVQIEIAATGICGSDLHVYESTPGYEFMHDRLPVTLGHEFAGTVAAAGSATTSFRVGDRVTAWPTTACGDCFHCRAERPQDCQAREVIGLHIDGGFAARVNVPAGNCYRLPEGLDLDLAALSEPLSIAENALDVGECAAGDAVVVLGPGPIGVALAWLAQHRGCAPVLLAGLHDSGRLALARRMGVEHCVDLADEPLADAVQRVFSRPVDRVIEATGVVDSVHQGLAVLRSSGILVVAGIHSQPIEIPLTQLVRDKKQLRAAHDTKAAAWPRVLAVLAEHGERLSEMITDRLPLADAIDGFERARNRDAMKILLKPETT